MNWEAASDHGVRTARSTVRGPHGHRWLTGSALEPNPFFDPAILEPAFAYLAPRSALYCAGVEPQTGLALSAMPVAPQLKRYGPLPVPRPLSAWLHPYAVNGTPLVSADDPTTALERLFDAARCSASGSTTLLFPMLSADGRVWPALKAFLEERGIRHAIISRTERAGLRGFAPGAPSAEFAPKKSRQSIRKSKNRLRKLGTLEHRVARSLPEIHEAVGTFLELEAAGWKGKRGTALRTIGHGDFFTTAVMNLAIEKRARIDQTLLDGKLIAATVTLASNDPTAPCWMPWKTAYEEAYRREAPGTVNLYDLTSSLVQDCSAKGQKLWLDSLAGPESVIAARLWPDRWHFINLLTDLSNGERSAFQTVLMAEKTRERGRQMAHSARSIVRQTRRSLLSRWSGADVSHR